MTHSFPFSRLIRAAAFAVALFCAAVAAHAAAPASPVKPLAWSDLIRHPERWPDHTTLKADVRFSDAMLPAGTEVKVTEVNGREAMLTAPQGFAFMAGPADCDLLEAANRQWAAFTPEQRALTLAAIEHDMSLWPGRTTLTQPASFGSFSLAATETYRLLKIEGGEVGLYVPGQRGYQMVSIASTDVFARARALAALPKEQRPGRMIEVLDGLMVDTSGQPVPVKSADFYVQYWSASTCPRCAVFTPKFIEHYNAVLAGQPRVAFFGSATDATMPPYFAYAERTGMPWPTLPDKNKGVILALGNMGNIEIPGIIVFDKFGHVLMSTSKMNGAPLAVAENALAQLDSKLQVPSPTH